MLYDYLAPVGCDTQWSTYLQCSGATGADVSNWDQVGGLAGRGRFRIIESSVGFASTTGKRRIGSQHS